MDQVGLFLTLKMTFQAIQSNPSLDQYHPQEVVYKIIMFSNILGQNI